MQEDFMKKILQQGKHNQKDKEDYLDFLVNFQQNTIKSAQFNTDTINAKKKTKKHDNSQMDSD
jgi:hypothetical protein